MNLQWFTLLNGILECFPTGTMKTFFGNREAACQGGRRPASPSWPRERVLTTSTETPACGLLNACKDRR